MQPALSFPAEVYHAARAAGLGSPIQEYNEEGQPVQKKGWLNLFTSKRTVSFLSWLLFWSIVPLVGVFMLGAVGLGFGAVLQSVFFPLNLVIDGPILVMGLFVIMLLNMIIEALWPGHMGDQAMSRAWSCPDGLIYQRGKRFHAIRWEQLANVTHQTAQVNGRYKTISYRVQLDDAPRFAFTLLTPTYARWIKPLHRSMGYTTISAGDLQLHFFWEGSILTISGALDLSAYDGLGTLIEKQMVRQRLPALLDAYRSGAGIPFGNLVFSKHGVTDGAKVLLWSELANIHISQRALQITKNPTELDWFYLSLLDMPNVALLRAFLAAIRRAQR